MGEAGWYISCDRNLRMKMFQFENWNIIENRFSRNTSNATK